MRDAPGLDKVGTHPPHPGRTVGCAWGATTQGRMSHWGGGVLQHKAEDSPARSPRQPGVSMSDTGLSPVCSGEFCHDPGNPFLPPQVLSTSGMFAIPIEKMQDSSQTPGGRSVTNPPTHQVIPQDTCREVAAQDTGVPRAKEPCLGPSEL